MKIIAISKLPPGITVEALKHHQVTEAAKAWQFYKSGVFYEIYLRTDQPGAVVVMECADVEEAKAKIDTLPMVKAGVLDFDVIPLGPFLPYELLFSK